MSNLIASFVSRVCLSAEAIASRQLLLGRQSELVRSLWPQAVLHPIGSFAQRTSLKSSDIDILLMLPGRSEERNSVISVANELKHAIISKGISKPVDCHVIEGARVPILTYMDQSEVPALRVDVSFQRDNAVRNTEYVKRCLDERPYMRDVLILMKFWLRSKQLHETYRGGLGSYALSLTVIGFFNYQRRVAHGPHLEMIAKGDTYGLFLDYLRFWTGSWKYSHFTMIPDTGERLSRNRPGYMLRIIDPTDSENDVGKQSWKIKGVITRMKGLLTRLQQAEEAGGAIGEREFESILGGTPKEREVCLKQKRLQENAMSTRAQAREARKAKKAKKKAARDAQQQKMKEKRIMKEGERAKVNALRKQMYREEAARKAARRAVMAGVQGGVGPEVKGEGRLQEGIQEAPPAA